MAEPSSSTSAGPFLPGRGLLQRVAGSGTPRRPGQNFPVTAAVGDSPCPTSFLLPLLLTTSGLHRSLRRSLPPRLPHLHPSRSFPPRNPCYTTPYLGVCCLEARNCHRDVLTGTMSLAFEKYGGTVTTRTIESGLLLLSSPDSWRGKMTGSNPLTNNLRQRDKDGGPPRERS